MNTWHWKSILSTASVAWESADWKTRLGLPTLIFDPGQMEGNRKKWTVKYIHLSWLLAVFLLWRGGMNMWRHLHVSFNKNLPEFTTYICLNLAFIICFYENMFEWRPEFKFVASLAPDALYYHAFRASNSYFTINKAKKKTAERRRIWHRFWYK